VRVCKLPAGLTTHITHEICKRAPSRLDLVASLLQVLLGLGSRKGSLVSFLAMLFTGLPVLCDTRANTRKLVEKNAMVN